MADEVFDVIDEESLVVRLHVVPGAGRTAVQGRHGEALKVSVAAPPERGRANAACAELLAEVLGVKAKAITLVSGETSRSKRFSVTGVDPEEVRGVLAALIEQPGPIGDPRGRRF